MSDTSAGGLNALCGTFTALSVITVALRFYARKCQKSPYLVDDWLMLPAVITYIGASICIFIAVSVKVLGYSTSQFTEAEIAATAEESAKLQVSIDVLTILCLGCTKASALFFYRRVFCASGLNPIFNAIVLSTVVVVTCWVVTFQFLAGFQCRTHLSALWDGTYLKYCTISFPFAYGWAVSDFLLDVWVLALPIPMILGLYSTLPKKLSILGVLLLACAGLGASIGRMVIFIQVETAGPLAFVKYDEEKMNTKGLYFAMLEAGMSLVAVNMPSMWLLLATKTPEAVLRSVRSMVSLASRGTKGSNGSKNQQFPDGPTSSVSVSSGTHLDEPSYDTYVMLDIDRPDAPGLASDKVYVKDSVQLSSEQRRHGEV